jgi:ribonuclease HII
LLCGIDEAGRGPLAGPLVFAGVILNKEIDGLNDSKKLSEKKREELFGIISTCPHYIVFTSNKTIDTLGLSACIANSLNKIISNLKADEYLFDGKCKFKAAVSTMVKADTLIPEVMAASILAKVSRDRFMQTLNISGFNFAKHKGYGTVLHMKEILENDLSSYHRKSFCKKFIKEPLDGSLPRQSLF